MFSSVLQVSQAFNDEIRRLSILVNEFEHTFHPDEFMIALYKKVILWWYEGCGLINRGEFSYEGVVLLIGESLIMRGMV